jgi:predicted extracellular nuclease
MRSLPFTFLGICLIILFWGPANIKAQERFQVAFYNVENYFDTVNNPEKKDDEFTPGGFKNWGFFKYRTKQNRIAKTLMALGKWEMPAVIGLAEVENRQVLQDLLTFSPLERFDYQILHQQSPDWRGIDVAALYQPKRFQVLDSQFIEVTFPKDSFNSTRDILYAKGLNKQTKDTLHFFVNHWPSRYGGKAETDPKRARAATILRNKIDSIYNQHTKPKIIITGDFNDGPMNASLQNVLNATTDTQKLASHQLINLMYPQAKSSKKGSYKYQYQWHTFDQFIVSKSLIKANKGFRTGLDHAHIYRPSFLMTTDDDYPGKIPHRTYLGPRYKDGYSDHLPIYLNLYTSQSQ